MPDSPSFLGKRTLKHPLAAAAFSTRCRYHLVAGIFTLLILAGDLRVPASVTVEESAQSAAPLETGLALHDAPRPFAFFDVTGRKSGVFGRQDSQFEAWIYPIKLLHNFRLEFQPQGALEPLRGEFLLREIVTRPESTTLVYVHPSFTVREIIWAPQDEAALVVQFEIDSSKPLDLTAAFVPDFRPMWPASFGGQHSEWLADAQAFRLTDGTRKPSAIIGSPSIADHTEFVDHQLGAGEMLLRFHFRPEDPPFAQPLVMAMSLESENAAREIFNKVLSGAARLFADGVRAHRQFLEHTVAIETPDPDVNRNFMWAKIALDSGWVCHATFGCGLIAGYGPSSAGERPGFAWWFGGDALMASWALEDSGDLSGALQVLRFLKAQQRADGKMLHELSQSAGLIDWFGKYPYAYYHADTTPMYLYSIDQYWRRTGDRQFLEEFWPSAKKAYQYCLSTISSDDGLMDNTKAGLAAVEVGVLRGKVTKDVYLEGFWLAGAEAMADLAAATGDPQLAQDARLQARTASGSLSKNWWNPTQHSFAFGLTADGRRADLVGAWPAVPLAISSFLDPGQAQQTARSLTSPKLSTDWGIRWLSNDDPLYDPLSYNNGTAWPFLGGMAAWAEFKQGLPIAGFQLWNSLTQLTGLSSPGMLPELMNGDRYLAGEFAVPHQLFSSVGVILPAVRGVLGLESNFSTVQPVSAQIRWHPYVPPDWPYLRFRHYPVDGGNLSGEILQQPGRVIVHLRSDTTKPVTVDIAPVIPSLARVRSVLLNSKPQKFFTSPSGSSVRIATGPLNLQPSQDLTLSVEYQGGIAIVPPPITPKPGDRSSSLHVLDTESDPSNQGCQLKLTLAGLAGREYALQLVSTLPQLHAGGLSVRKTPSGYEIRVPFAGTAYVSRQVCLGP